jgi:photosystem II stability/assembly factor-like uncharacterized protein
MKPERNARFEKIFLGLMICLLLAAVGWSQGRGGQVPVGPAVNPSEDPILKEFRWRSIGPASMAGRIDDIEAVESNPSVFYVAFATGGLWKTVNNGTTFEPIFDNYPVISIGDIAIFQADPKILWVGTGEPNNRQSSSYGGGVWKSTDAGKTFTYMGLKETQSIARIVTDPKDPNVVYVAALGHLFGPNKERGIYKTTDGGQTWTNLKFIDEDTGFTDLVIDPVDTKTLYAASYQRRRTAWGFNGGGAGSGIWKTIDAGKTWARLAGGLPGPELGRIGLDISRSNPNTVYAQMEVRKAMGTGVGAELPLNATPEQIAAAQSGRGGGGGGGGRGGAAGTPDPTRDGVWRSDDKGKTWRFQSNCNDRAMYYSQIRVDPSNSEIVYAGGAPFFKSTDGGKTFQQVQGIVHTDNHAIWVDPKNGNHLIIGHDGGLCVTYDQTATWEFINTIAVGQFYAVAADMRKPYYVYGGLQDNGSWGGPSATRGGSGITNAEWFRVGGGDGFYCQVDPTDYNTLYTESQNGAMSRYDLKTGRSTSIQPRAAGGRRGGQAPPTTAETQPGQPPAQAVQAPPAGAPGGFPGMGGSNIVPALPAGEQLRWYWNTPIVLSPHNPRTVYTAANRFFKSLNRGDTWMAGPDLTRGVDRRKLPILGIAGDAEMFSKHDGAASFGHIVTLAESAAVPGIIWAGTDDGNVQVTRDGGLTFKNVADNIPGIPKDRYYQVTRVAPSHFDAGTCYVTLDGHRYDDMKPYIFVTKDFGVTWTSLVNNLPAEFHINVILEDAKNRNLLYLGTEMGFYISLNAGKEWKKFMTGLPNVPVDDVIVHPRENDLILGTHGRSIFIMDDISALQQLTETEMANEVRLMDVRPATLFQNDIYLDRSIARDKNFRGENPAPGTAIHYFLKTAVTADVKIAILDIEGRVLQEMTGSKEAGLHRVQWRTGGGGRGGFGGGGGGGLPPGVVPPAGGTAGGAAAGAQAAGGRGAAGAQGAAGRGGAGQAATGAAQAGGGQAQFQGGGGRGGSGGGGVEPGVYRVRLTVGDKEYFTRVIVEADPNVK